MTLVSGGESDLPSICPAVQSQSLRRGLSTNPGATTWCVCGCSCRDGAWVLQRDGDGCDLASTLCKVDLR